MVIRLRIKEKENKLKELEALRVELHNKSSAILKKQIDLRHEINSEYIAEYLQWLHGGGRDKFKIGDRIMVVRNYSKLYYAGCPQNYVGMRGIVEEIIGNTIKMRKRDNYWQICSYSEIELDYNLYEEDFAEYVEDYSKRSIQGWLK